MKVLNFKCNNLCGGALMAGLKYFDNFKFDTDALWYLGIALCLTSLIVIIPDAALAATTAPTLAQDPIGKVLCNIVSFVQGNIGRALGVLALMFISIGLFLGKINWGIAIATGVGIAGIFGAPQIVGFIGGTGAGTAGGTAAICT